MLPFALALQKTGGIALATSGLVGLLGDAGPHALLACLFLLTAVIGLFISNTATAVLMAPVALSTAEQLGASPYPFAMIVALAALYRAGHDRLGAAGAAAVSAMNAGCLGTPTDG